MLTRSLHHIPTTPFAGQANISISLYDVKYKNLSIALSIEYATEGNKVEDQPG
ncbi:hypothetical protein GO495_08220 [Chitinophaga oryziterrae]|uniref:Uncharacterized protein n=1 Tax=Chitinophaga oryziterrae TaxID=1031224 RepID=A0A6N8J5M4_9BACT|nr:hypothetical protein [Chitinophaga oryziterrae]MVT40565.1 hypothetical protein [Chitinophaga oryziterrae]